MDEGPLARLRRQCKVSFSVREPGVREGTMRFVASDEKGYEQSIYLRYCAFVQP